MHVEAMLKTHPQLKGKPDDSLVRAIEACADCAVTCTLCADACLGEAMVAELRRCIRLDLDCAEICRATGAILARYAAAGEPEVRAVLRACVETCRRCAEEGARHAAHHAHCRVCAEVCKACADACEKAQSAAG
jgi:Domain of Unknown Function (DUF326)